MSKDLKARDTKRVDNTRSAQARTATLDRKAARTAKRFIVGGSK